MAGDQRVDPLIDSHPTQFDTGATSWVLPRPVWGTCPPPPPGIIFINPQPAGLPAPWELSGPGGYSNAGSGAATLTDMEPGGYEISWGVVDGYHIPPPPDESKELVPGGAITFTGLYDPVLENRVGLFFSDTEFTSATTNSNVAFPQQVWMYLVLMYPEYEQLIGFEARIRVENHPLIWHMSEPYQGGTLFDPPLSDTGFYILWPSNPLYTGYDHTLLCRFSISRFGPGTTPSYIQMNGHTISSVPGFGPAYITPAHQAISCRLTCADHLRDEFGWGTVATMFGDGIEVVTENKTLVGIKDLFR